MHAIPRASSLIPLRSGRRLEIVELGDPLGRPAFFFHGLIGSYCQAIYVEADARRLGLRILAVNRPGVGRSDPTPARRTPLEAAGELEELADALGIGRFAVIGISGGAPYAYAALLRLPGRITSATIISGMGPVLLPGGLQGMNPARRAGLLLGSKYPRLAVPTFRGWEQRFAHDPAGFLDRFIAASSRPDRLLFRTTPLAELFLEDLHQVFDAGHGPMGIVRELATYRRFGFRLEDLPANGPPIRLWHGLDDNVVPPGMALGVARRLPNAELHLGPGGHFVAVAIASRITEELARGLDPTQEAARPG